MKDYQIEIYESDFVNALSFPEVGNYNISVEIDENIFRNLKHEIDWAKKYNIEYANIKSIIKYCKEKLKKADKATKRPKLFTFC